MRVMREQERGVECREAWTVEPGGQGARLGLGPGDRVRIRGRPHASLSHVQNTSQQGSLPPQWPPHLTPALQAWTRCGCAAPASCGSRAPPASRRRSAACARWLAARSSPPPWAPAPGRTWCASTGCPSSRAATPSRECWAGRWAGLGEFGEGEEERRRVACAGQWLQRTCGGVPGPVCLSRCEAPAPSRGHAAAATVTASQG